MIGPADAALDFVRVHARHPSMCVVGNQPRGMMGWLPRVSYRCHILKAGSRTCEAGLTGCGDAGVLSSGTSSHSVLDRMSPGYPRLHGWTPLHHQRGLDEDRI